jgi:hypothetical protein
MALGQASQPSHREQRPECLPLPWRWLPTSWLWGSIDDSGDLPCVSLRCQVPYPNSNDHVAQAQRTTLRSSLSSPRAASTSAIWPAGLPKPVGSCRNAQYPRTLEANTDEEQRCPLWSVAVPAPLGWGQEQSRDALDPRRGDLSAGAGRMAEAGERLDGASSWLILVVSGDDWQWGLKRRRLRGGWEPGAGICGDHMRTRRRLNAKATHIVCRVW